LIVDDGRLNIGYKVVSFVVFPYAPAGATQQTPVTLGLDYDMGPNMDASDNRQIGWAVTVYGTGSLEGGQISVIDPDHIVVRDLYIRNENSNDEVNYLIELEAVELSDDQAVLALIKERSQDDWR
jgi:hypothetical protein